MCGHEHRRPFMCGVIEHMQPLASFLAWNDVPMDHIQVSISDAHDLSGYPLQQTINSELLAFQEDTK